MAATARIVELVGVGAVRAPPSFYFLKKYQRFPSSTSVRLP